MQRTNQRRLTLLAILLAVVGVVIPSTATTATAAPSSPSTTVLGVQTPVPGSMKLPSEVTPASVISPQAWDFPTAYQALPAPVRVLDTRNGTGGVHGPLAHNHMLTFSVAGAVPAQLTSSVFINLTATNTTGVGYLTAFRAGSPMPLTSTINVAAGGDIRSNAAMVEVRNGEMSIAAYSTMDVVVDVYGYNFVGFGTEVKAGRIHTLDTSVRIIDTRKNLAGSRMTPDSTLKYFVLKGNVKDAKLPANADALILTVTATETEGPGYLTVYPSNQPRPLVSTVNFNKAGVTIPNLTIVKIGGNNSIDFYSYGGTQLIVDVKGYITDGSDDSAMSTHGTLMMTDPTRVIDTRQGDWGGKSGSREVNILRFDSKTMKGAGVPANASCLVLNVTAIDAEADGFIALYIRESQYSGTVPDISDVNYVAGGPPVANMVIVGTSYFEGSALFRYTPVHVAVDLVGYCLN